MINFAKPTLALALFCLTFPLCAAPGLYSAEVRVDDQSAEVREEALQQALGQVLVRVSGDADAALSTAGREVTSRARQLVQQFGYKRAPLEKSEDEAEDKTANPDQADEAEVETELFLHVRFNAGAVNNALRNAGMPVWGSERPETIVWLTRAQGGSPSLIDGEEAQPLKQVAKARGVPLVFPQQDSGERQRANAADVIAGYNDRLLAVSRGYGASHLLVGTLRNNGGFWQGKFTLMQSQNALDEWQDGAASQEQLLNEAMRRVANNFAKRYAVSANSPGNTVMVAIDRLNSALGFARVSNYLADLTAVQSVIPAFINPEYAVFQVQLSGDTQVLSRGIGLADWLETDEAASGLARPYSAGGVVLGYRLTP